VTVKACGAICPDEPQWACSRAQGHGGRHESDDGGDWYDDEPAPTVQCPPIFRHSLNHSGM